MTIGKHISKIIWLLNIHKLIIKTLFVFRRILHVLSFALILFLCGHVNNRYCYLPYHQDFICVLFVFSLWLLYVEFLYGIYVFNLSCWLYFTYQCMLIIHEFLLTTSSFHCLELFKIT